MYSPNRYAPEVNDFIRVVSLYIDGAVAGFFLLSGYFAGLADERGLPRLRDVARRGLRRLIVPFLLFSLLNGLALALLGKIAPLDIARAILGFEGVGPQMYFLPYLFLVQCLTHAAFALAPAAARPALALVAFALFLAASLAAPVSLSTGPNYWLLLFYEAAFLAGICLSFAERRRAGAWPSLLALGASLGVLILALATEPRPGRLFDFALVAALSCAALAVSHGPWLARRLPGSGGIYLLHTPVLNHALSAALLAFGIGGLANLFGALVLTYLVALAATLVAIRRWPRMRALLLE